MPILTNSNGSVRADSKLSGTWQAEMKDAIRDLGTLVDRLNLPAEFKQEVSAIRDFPVFVPASYLNRIQKGSPTDPLLLQVLPVADEDQFNPGFTADPLLERSSTLTPGLLQKYRRRALMIVAGACAIHCRYCFRRHFPYQESPKSVAHWEPAFAELESDLKINEIILSGGDPLTLVDAKLGQLVNRLEQITNLKRLRIHTRLPVVIPNRITDELVNILSQTGLQSIVVIHVNHAQELDSEVKRRLEQLHDAGILLLNQSVLLRGINDNEKALTDLSERLLECNVLPYYLHQLDPVAGAAHFQVPIERGMKLIAKLRANAPGYAVPRYVQEIPGELNKTVLA